MSDITHFCDLNSPDKLKDAIVDHPKLRELCHNTDKKSLRQYLAYINADRKVEIAIITSEIEEKTEAQAVCRHWMIFSISAVAAAAAIASAFAAWFSYLSSKSLRLQTQVTATETTKTNDSYQPPKPRSDVTPNTQSR